VGGIPILLFNLFLLKQSGIQNITINLHHLPQKIQELLKNSKRLGLHLTYSIEKPKILGTAGGIAQALRKMKNTDTFVLNGDILMNINLKKFFETHQKSKALATLACVPSNFAKVRNFVEFNQSGRIIRIAGEPKYISKKDKFSRAIFSGAHLVNPSLFQGYPSKQFGCVIRQVYQPALDRGDMLQAYQHRGNWWDLGSLEELERVDQELWKKSASPKIVELWEEVREWAKPLFR
jgi:NDP-sugar pyrophosphorylase family protein